MTLDYDEIAWAGGFFEGEGCFGLGGPTRRSLQITASQKTREPLDRLRAALGNAGTIRRKAHKKSAYFEWQVGGVTQGRLIIRLLWPGLSTRRRAQAQKLLDIEPLPHANQSMAKTQCPRGHAYDAINAAGRRICRVCNAAKSRRSYAKTKIRLLEGNG